MPKKKKPTPKKTNPKMRYANPYFENAASAAPKAHPVYGTKAADFAQTKLNPFPTGLSANPVFELADIIGAQAATEIENSGSIIIQSTGDTGHGPHSPEETVADAMAKAFNPKDHTKSPAFLLHLGDVIYSFLKNPSYTYEFYEPYSEYPGKIVAIPGNHDGEIVDWKTGKSMKPGAVSGLEAFVSNFCAPTAAVPDAAGGIVRETMTQPNVYWYLDCPFVDILGLYSNIDESTGYLEGATPTATPGPAQVNWLTQTLKSIKAARAKSQKFLLIATHHPPYCGGAHPSSPQLADSLNKAYQAAGLWPDLFLSGHAHNYQRYEVDLSTPGGSLKVPHLVAGNGGYGLGQVPSEAIGAQMQAGVTLENKGEFYGYLQLQISDSQINVQVFDVKNPNRPFETIKVTKS